MRRWPDIFRGQAAAKDKLFHEVKTTGGIVRNIVFGFLALLLGLLVLLILPVGLPVMLAMGWYDRRQKKKIASQTACIRCQKLLGDGALLESSRVQEAEWRTFEAKFPGVRFARIRRHHAICTDCGQRYGYSHAERAFLPADPEAPASSSTLTIRRLNPGEGEFYRTLRLQALEESPSAFTTTLESALSRTPESWAAQADASATGADRATFVVLSPAPAGLAALYRTADDPSCGELLQMWVAPAHRGRGVAGKLIDHVFAWAAENGFRKVRAGVTRGNEPALRFYLKCGFTREAGAGDEIVLVRDVKG